MSGRQAKVITEPMLKRMLSWAGRSSTPDRDRVIILLSAKAGLRACEIAGVEWPMVLDARGRVGKSLMIEDRISKKGSGRRIPMHRDLRAALVRLQRRGSSEGPIVVSGRGSAMRPNSIVNWFVALFHSLEFEGCSSHSGRRTFITNAARRAYGAGGCLRDVQILAGHKSLSMTQVYIDGDTNVQRRIVAMI